MSVQVSHAGLGPVDGLVASLKEVVFRLDLELRHVFMSPVIEKWTGLSPASFIGKTVREMGLAPDACDAFERAARRALARGEAEDVHYSDRGRTFHSRLVPEFDDHGQTAALLCMTEDTTEAAASRVEPRWSNELEAMTRLNHLSTRFIRGNLTAVLGEVVDAAIAITQADAGNIQLLDTGTGRLRIRAHRGHEPWWLEYFESVAAGPGSSCGTALERAARVVVEDVTTSPVFVGTPSLAVLLRAGIRAVQSTPLVDSSGQLVGMISTHFHGPHRPGERELRFLDLLAHQAAEMVEHARAEEALRENEVRLRRYAELVEHAPVLVRDLASNVLVWNEGMERLYGWTRADVLGKSSHEVLQTKFPEPLPHIVATVMREGRWEGELVHRRRDGSALTVASSWTLHRDAAGGPDAVIEVNTDITALKRAEAALREADRAKNEFLGMLGHELRNPLAPIQNSAHLLNRVDPTSPQAERARIIIARQVHHLTRLVDDLLDVKRISTGKLRLHKTVMDLTQQVSETLEDLRPLFVDRSLELELRTPGHAIWVNGDRTRLAQMVTNLLQNAAKFTNPGGHVLVTLEAHGGEARLRVCDDGAGIAPEMLETLFEPFVQGERTLDRTTGGLGLGLSLVRGIAELHGGTVVAQSEGAGQGTEFIVTLPTTEQLFTTKDEKLAPKREVRCRVLLIEDNVDAAESLRDVIDMIGGHEVFVAHDGEAGIAAAREHEPNVILCDLGLPVIDGYEVARRIRSDGIAAGARLIALTGYASAEDIERAIRAGFDYHMPKPPDIDRVLSLVADARGCAASGELPCDVAAGSHEAGV